MAEYSVSVIRGDGIGIEVIEEGIKVLDAVGREYGIGWDWVEHPWGSEYYIEHGEVMPSDGLDTLQKSDAIFLGAVGHPDIQDHVTLGGLLLPIRRSFDQYVCERPSVLYPGIESPLAGYSAGEIDMVVVRENTEGEYADVGGFVYPDFPEELGIQSAVFTRKGCERIIRHAFEVARRRDRDRHVTSITKSNALGYGMLVWDRAFERVAAEYPDIETLSLLIDAACMDFVRRPETFDVVVGSNLFGDILTDIGAIITGKHGTGAEREHRPGTQVSVHVRAGARVGAGHHGAGNRQPAGGYPVRGDDAAAPGTRGRGGIGGEGGAERG